VSENSIAGAIYTKGGSCKFWDANVMMHSPGGHCQGTSAANDPKVIIATAAYAQISHTLSIARDLLPMLIYVTAEAQREIKLRVFEGFSWQTKTLYGP